MIREVDLVSYLPPFMAEFKEIMATLEAENPEFVLVWEAADRVLQNEFIETSDEYGISRWERILGAFPKTTDTLENRRFHVMSRINETRPFTIPQLKNILQTLCGKNNYSVKVSECTLIIRIGLTSKNNFNDVEALIEKISPANMVVDLSLAYNQHQTVQAMTHSQLAEMTHYDIRNETMKG